MSKKLLFRLAVLVATMMCALGARADEAYANYTPENTTLYFYYDNERNSCSGTTYDLNTGSSLPGWYIDGTYANVTRVVFGIRFNQARPTSTYYWFYGMRNLETIVDLNTLDTSEATNMSHMFYGCENLTGINLFYLNTAKVTNMSYMFYNCKKFVRLAFNNAFKTSRVTDMRYMFYGCSNLRTINVGNAWNTAAVTDSYNMFAGCYNLEGDKGTYYQSSNPKDKTYAHLDGGTSNPGYFSEFKQAYACFTPSNTTLTFYYDNLSDSREGRCYTIGYDIHNISPSWQDNESNNVTKVIFDPSFADALPTNTYGWFAHMTKLESITGLSYLNTSVVVNMGFMFYDCNKLTSLDLSHFNTTQVTNMNYMFYGCNQLTSLDLSSFNTSNVTDMRDMFYHCNKLRTIIAGVGWSTAAVTSPTNMFYNCTSLVGGQGTTYDANHIDESYAHIDGGTSNPGYFTDKGLEAYAHYTPSNTALTFYCDRLRSTRAGTTYDMNKIWDWPGWRTDGTCSRVTKVVFNSSFAAARPISTCYWFNYMQNLQSITGLNYLNTSEVTDMTYMFAGSNKLISLDVSGFNTHKVTSMRGMFDSCRALTSLDLSNFNTSQVTDMEYMFNNCDNLRTIRAGIGWSTSAVTSSDGMFIGCTSLVGGQGTTYDINHTDKTYAHIDGGPSNPGYLTDENAPEAYACYTSSNTTLTFYYDNLRSSRSGKTYNLNTGSLNPDWYTDGTNFNVTKVVFNSSFAAARPTSTYRWFYNMTNLKSITSLNFLNTSEVTNMSWMFYGCNQLTSLNLSSFNTSRVTDMCVMFYNCNRLTSLYLGNFNTVNVTDMNGMFYGCSSLTSIDVSQFNTAKVTNMCAMFYQCNQLASLDLSNFNTSRVTIMENMFYGCSVLTSLDLSSFNTASVTDMRSMFQGCSNLADLDMSNFNTSQVTDMSYMFYACTNINRLDLGSFNTSRVTDMPRMFLGCTNLHTIYVGNGWSTAAVTSSDNMFNGCYDLVGGMGTAYSSSNPTDKTYAHIDGTSNPGYFTAAGTEAYACCSTDNTTLTFYYDNRRSSRSGTTYSLNEGRNDPDWVVDGTNASVTKVVFDFSFAGARPTTTYEWFDSMKNLHVITGLNYLNTSEVTNMAYMFYYCSVLTNVNLSNFNTAKVSDMHSMFYNCSKLVSLDLSSFNTSNVSDMHSMFYYCFTLKSLDLSSFNTSNVTDMRDMFNGCIEMMSLNLGSFNTSKVTNMQSMFINCIKLQTIYAGNDWSTAAVTSSSSMFDVCSSLVGGKGTTYDANHIDKTYAHLDGGPSDPGYLTLVGTEAYACFTPADSTVTFYYDNLRNTRSGTTYNMNTNSNIPGWTHYGNYVNVAKMVFDPSFAAARPTSTYRWFYYMTNLKSITGLNYLNTCEVTDMEFMFTNCKLLTSIDLGSFNTSKVVHMIAMFSGCTNLRTIYVGDSWSTAAVTSSNDMFWNCTSLVGGKGTAFDANHIDKTYAHIDGGTSNPGYFTDKNAGLRGDVDGDSSVNISDVTALIDYLLSGNASGINLSGADCNQDSSVNISDVTALIDYLLSGTWN